MFGTRNGQNANFNEWLREWWNRLRYGNPNPLGSRNLWTTEYYFQKKDAADGGLWQTGLIDELRLLNNYGKRKVAPKPQELDRRFPHWWCKVFKLNCPPDGQYHHYVPEIYHFKCNTYDVIDVQSEVRRRCHDWGYTKPIKVSEMDLVYVVQTNDLGYDANKIPPYVARVGGTSGIFIGGYQPAMQVTFDKRPECRYVIYHGYKGPKPDEDKCPGFQPVDIITQPYFGQSYTDQQPTEWFLFNDGEMKKHFTIKLSELESAPKQDIRRGDTVIFENDRKGVKAEFSSKPSNDVGDDINLTIEPILISKEMVYGAPKFYFTFEQAFTHKITYKLTGVGGETSLSQLIVMDLSSVPSR